MNNWDLFVLVLGVFLLGDGLNSLRKLPIYQQQLQEIIRRCNLYKNANLNSIFMSMEIDDIKNTEDLELQKAKLDALYEKYFVQEIYQKDYPPLEKAIKSLIKIIGFFARFSILTGVFCLFAPFVNFGEMPVDILGFDIIMGWLLMSGVVGIILFPGHNKSGQILPITFKGSYKLLFAYFVELDDSKAEQIWQLYEGKSSMLLMDYIIVRCVCLFLFYLGTIAMLMIFYYFEPYKPY